MVLQQELRLQPALVSALTGKPVSREVGMTGEVTLRGRVLPIGGIKRKIVRCSPGRIETDHYPKR